jgi:hypothetical protein
LQQLVKSSPKIQREAVTLLGTIRQSCSDDQGGEKLQSFSQPDAVDSILCLIRPATSRLRIYDDAKKEELVGGLQDFSSTPQFDCVSIVTARPGRASARQATATARMGFG